MKKLILILLSLSLTSVFLFSGCKKEDPLLPYVSELRENIYEGNADGFFIKANYGFSEYPLISDGNVGAKRYALTFLLSGDINTEIEDRLSFSFGGNDYFGTFAFDPVKESRVLSFYIENFYPKTFVVSFGYSDKTTEVELKSIVPDGVADYKEILSSLYEKQTAFIDGLKENGKFSAEISLRILVRDGKAYYYVGVTKQNYLKAFLMDAKTKELLAIREIR